MHYNTIRDLLWLHFVFGTFVITLIQTIWSSFCSTEMLTLKLKMTSFKFKNLILQNKWTLLTMKFYKTKWLWMQKNRKHLLVFWWNVYIIMDFTVIIHFTAISIDGTGVTFYWQNTINALAIDFLKYWTVFLCWFRRIKNVGDVCTHFITSVFIFSHGCCWSMTCSPHDFLLINVLVVQLSSASLFPANVRFLYSPRFEKLLNRPRKNLINC
jgi:hypothetical protein